jgi:hypothetical protein
MFADAYWCVLLLFVLAIILVPLMREVLPPAAPSANGGPLTLRSPPSLHRWTAQHR